MLKELLSTLAFLLVNGSTELRLERRICDQLFPLLVRREDEDAGGKLGRKDHWRCRGMSKVLSKF